MSRSPKSVLRPRKNSITATSTAPAGITTTKRPGRINHRLSAVALAKAEDTENTERISLSPQLATVENPSQQQTALTERGDTTQTACIADGNRSESEVRR